MLLQSPLLHPIDQQYSSILCADFNELKEQVIWLLFQILHTNLTKVFIQPFLSTFDYLQTYFSCMCAKRCAIPQPHPNYFEFSGRLLHQSPALLFMLPNWISYSK